MSLKLTLLGHVQLTKDDKLLKAVRPKSIALLSYLINEKRSFSRPHLITVFWPQQDESAGRRNLSWTLNNLKSHIPRCLDVQGESIGYNVNCQLSVDVLAFVAHASLPDSQTLQIAIDQYAGPFMDGFYLRRCAAFEQWHAQQQEGLRQRFVAALAKLLPLYERHPQKALATADKWLATDEWQETAHQARLIALTQLGRKADALAHFKQFADRLAAELSTTPTPATLAIVEQIRQDQIKRILVDKRGYVPEPPAVLFGRISEQKRLRTLLLDRQARLITLMGHGGMGKTHLAITLGRDLMTNFPDGVWFVPLEAVMGDGAAVALAIFETIGLKAIGKNPLTDQLAQMLAEKEMLLILDNCEHLTALAPFINKLVQNCPTLQILVTSRARLYLRTEHVVRLSGLPIATNGWQLFDDRSKRFGALWRSTPSQHHNDSIRAICELVEGLPLGIELAAATDNDPTAVLAALQANLSALETPMHDVPTRQRSLVATFTYAWNLLSAELQQIVAGAANFVGGWTVESAQIVLNATEEQLQQLVDRSLFSLVDGRYRMHGLLARFSAEKQPTPPSTYANYFADLTDQAHVRFQEVRSAEPFQAILPEMANIRQAWRIVVTTQSFEQITPFTKGLYRLCDIMGRHYAGHSEFMFAMQHLAATPLDRRTAELRKHLGLITYCVGDYERFVGSIDTASTYLEAALALLLEFDDQIAINNCRRALADFAITKGEYAEAHQRLALVLDDITAGDTLGRIITLGGIAIPLLALGRYEEAQAAFDEVIAFDRAANDKVNLPIMLNNKGMLLLAMKDIAGATAAFEEALTLRKEVGDPYRIGLSLLSLGRLALAQQDGATALAQFGRCYELLIESGGHRPLAAARIGIGSAHLMLNNLENARAEAAKAQAIVLETGNLPHVMNLCSLIARLLYAEDHPDAVEWLMWVAGHQNAEFMTRMQLVEFMERVGVNSAEITPHKSPWRPRLTTIDL